MTSSSLSDTWYVSQLQMIVATLKISMEWRNRCTGGTEKVWFWEAGLGSGLGRRLKVELVGREVTSLTDGGTQLKKQRDDAMLEIMVLRGEAENLHR